MKLNELLGDPAWLFDFGFPISQLMNQTAKPERLEWKLRDEHAIPEFGSLSGGKRFADAFIAWNEDGVFFQTRVKVSDAKTSAAVSGSPAGNAASKTVHCSLYVDTRWSPGVHRATQFCHRFDFILNRPTQSQPEIRGHGELAPIQRARAAPADIHPTDISVGAYFLSDGYEIRAFLRGDALTGYSPFEFPDVGIFYTINDTLVGSQIIARTLQSPFFEDPSVWCRAKLLQPQT
jgi:hypothetical protein